MKRPSRLRRGRIGVAVAIALAVGALAPSLSASGPATAATDGQMVYPASGNIQSKVGDGCRGNYRAHEGIDISAAGGTPILAAYSGVIKSRTVNSGYGNYTDVEHPGGYVTRYAHMASPGTFAPGTRVERGQQIGIVGNTGNSPAFHLHFEVRLNGAVYTRINDGFVCLTNVSRGGALPLTFPGLRTEQGPPIPPADFTGDGRSDLLLVAGNGDLRLMAGTGSGSFHAASTVASGWAGNRRHLTRADLNGDGRGDVLAARTDGVLELHAGNGSGGFAAPVSIGSGWYDMLHVTSGADYTGDGKHDVLGVFSSGSLVIYPGNGSGGLSASSIAAGGGWQGFHFLVGGDFNNDGRGDIIALSDTGTLYFYPGVTGGFAAPVAVGGGWLEFTAATGGADYDGDGRADLLVRSRAGELFFYPGNGDGAFGARRIISADWADHLAIE